MKKYPKPTNELERIKALKKYAIMDSLPEEEYDAITKLASFICGTPISLVSLLDEERQWFKSTVGIDASETPREISFCQHAIMGDDVYEITNTLEDATFVDNPLVTGDPNIRFYAGAPIKDENGFNLGTLCVIDTVPRELSKQQKESLQLLSNQVVSLLKLRNKNSVLETAQKEFLNFVALSKDLVCIANIDGNFYKVNPAFTAVLGYDVSELEGESFFKFLHPDDHEKTILEVEKLSNGQESISFENRFYCKNGDLVFLSWNSSPDPTTGNLYCIARDMTSDKKQQEKLYNLTTDLTAILNSAEFSIIATDIEGTIKQFNKGAEKLLGYEASEVIGLQYPYKFHVNSEVESNADALSKEYELSIENPFETFVYKAKTLKAADSQEWNYVNSNGKVFPVQLSMTAIHSETGETIGYLGIAKDITKEKQAEDNLIKNKLLLDESQRIAKIGSWKYDVRSKELIWSKGHYLIFELEDLPASELNAAYRNRIHPEDLVMLDQLEDNFAKSNEDFKINYRILLPDGRMKYILEIGSAFTDGDQNVIGMQGNIQDVTDIKIAQDKIADKAKEINDIRAALDEAAIVNISDEAGVLTYVNDKFCNISQYSQTELLGQRLYSNDLGTEASILVRKIWLYIINGKTWKGELQQLAKDGSLYWVETTIVPFIDNTGKPYQYVAISFDITAKKMAETKLTDALINLEKNNKELDQFAYVVSHDLKAPLRAINNLAEWIVEDMPEMPDDVRKNLGLLRGRILRMENLINGVLDYSRIGRTKIEKEYIDLNELVGHIVESLVPSDNYKVAISDLPIIFNAKILLYQVFSNLISNAVKYNDKELGLISCTYSSLDEFHQFTIADNGPGIEEEYHDKVFGVFQTIEARDKKESTGIGLSIVKKIIDEGGGAIHIETNEHGGASFIFTVPK
ncbi:PAS domain S-box protein [Flavobacterium frigidarium]|uniref:PAS domain S-box protein n=1 Tax=Flavobacterium frigidarium TaxID=99286 RepID=UPI0030D80DDC|tara:strand:- start:16845 stop:19592 length:2748 start_codon:yes stop_codon:yes gene_type:complete